MISDVTSQLFKSYFEKDKLGKLSIDFVFGKETKFPSRNIQEPPQIRIQRGEVSVDLSKVFRSITGYEAFSYTIDPANIESICIHGSTLYNHFPFKREEYKSKRFHFFGPERVRQVYEHRDTPHEVDLMILLKEGLTGDKVIVPERTRNGNRVDQKTVISEGKTRKVMLDPLDLMYGAYVYEVDGAVAKIDVSATTFPGYRDERTMPLHLAYRSIDQFIEGIGKGDFLSEEVTQYGIALIGNGNFKEIVANIKSIERKPFHNVIWSEDLNGNLNGKVYG